MSTLTIANSCELLSKIIIFETKNNSLVQEPPSLYVVNCFQKLLSSRRRTTNKISNSVRTELWIAFKNYYLRDEEQQIALILIMHLSCELLSKIIIFETKNNLERDFYNVSCVVNCFQKLLSSRRRTTYFEHKTIVVPLWIAFKNYYLRDEEQQAAKFAEVAARCELLSKIIIFETKNNRENLIRKIGIVVNCFQKLLSSRRRTTWQCKGEWYS